jgi:hypothetical protein
MFVTAAIKSSSLAVIKESDRRQIETSELSNLFGNVRDRGNEGKAARNISDNTLIELNTSVL